MLKARRVYPRPFASPRRPAGDRTLPELVVVGAASRDVAASDPRGWRLGGAVTYCSLAAARLGLRVGAVVGLDELAADAAELVLLEDAGVLVRRVHLPNGPVFENIDRDGHRRQRWLSKSAGLGAEMLPEAWRLAEGWIFGPVAGEIDRSWAQVPKEGARIGVGWQGMLRSFEPTGWVERVDPERSELLQRAGLVCASVNDVAPGADLRDLRRLAGGAGAAMVLTDGARGGMALDGDGLIRYEALTAGAVVDPTGAGDIFLAALMAAWLLTGELVTPRNLRFAAAAGSLAIEGVGLAGVPSRSAVAARLRSGTTANRSRA